MKPVVTWIVVANARTAHVFANHGPGKGLTELEDKTWQAPDVGKPRDRAGMGHSIAGPGVAAVEQTDLKEQADAGFAKEIVEHLSKACTDKAFNRLIMVSGPHMLGLIRANLDGPLQAALVGEIPKDLTAQSVLEVQEHVGALIAV